MTVRKPEATGPSVTRRDPASSEADEVPTAPEPAPAPAVPPSEVSPPSFGTDTAAETPAASEPVTPSEDAWTPAPTAGRHRSPEPATERPSGHPGNHRSPMETNGLPDDHPALEPEPTEDDNRPPEPRRDFAEQPNRPSRTRPDVTARDRVPAAPSPWRAQRPRPAAPAEDMSRLDARARRTLVDEFVGAFVGGPTWQALLVVLEGAFPGLGVAATLATSTDEIWREIAALDERGAVARIGIPLWLGPSGLEVDLSAHWHSTPGNGGRPRPRASRPYRQALVVDTIDPLRYHRPVSGPSSPHDRPFDPDAFDLETDPPEGVPPFDTARFAPAFDQPGENDHGRAHGDDEDDTGVVIVADLTAAGVRVLDAVTVWRFASRIIADTLRDPRRPETWARTRRTLRSLRRVVVVDPRLGLGLCLGLDDRHTPRCLLVFRIERTEVATPRFVRP